jgi:hypothetical protein
MTVESFGDQTVQAVATALLAAISLLGVAVLLALTIVQRRANEARVVPIVLSRAAARPMTHQAAIPPHQRLAASLPSRAPPLSLHRPDRIPRDQGMRLEG